MNGGLMGRLQQIKNGEDGWRGGVHCGGYNMLLKGFWSKWKIEDYIYIFHNFHKFLNRKINKVPIPHPSQLKLRPTFLFFRNGRAVSVAL